MELRRGRTFSDAEPGEVIDFLQGRKVESRATPPDMLFVVNDGSELRLRLLDGEVVEYPIREAFLFKLLKWFQFPARSLGRFSIDTITSILNDHLLAIKGGEVTLRIEDGEVLSMTSNRYNEVADLEILDLLAPLGIRAVSRNDFFTRIYTEALVTVEPVPGDLCGLGVNVFNSETGFSALSVRHFILRYICANGAVRQFGSVHEDRIHYGHPGGAVREFLMTEIRKRKEEEEIIRGRLMESTKQPYDRVLPFAQKTLLGLIGRKRTHELLGGLPEKASSYDLANAVTHFAKSLDIGRRLRAEMLGGTLMVPGG